MVTSHLAAFFFFFFPGFMVPLLYFGAFAFTFCIYHTFPLAKVVHLLG